MKDESQQQVPPLKHKYFPGNYDNKCCLCKKQIHLCDKMCFVCEECYELNGMEGKTKLPASLLNGNPNSR